MPCGCKEKTPAQKLSEAELMRAKRVVRWAAWFVSLDEPLRLLRFCSEEDAISDLPEDGLLDKRLKYADGTGDATGPDGWTVVMETSAGLLFQSTGDQNRPDADRYPGAKFIKDKLAPSALLHVASDEARAWR